MRLSPTAHTDTFCRDNLPPVQQWPEFCFDLPELLRYPDRLNCAEALLEDTIAAFGADRPCLLSGAQSWSYEDLRRRANQIAQLLTEEFGLVPGNRVLLRGPNNPWLVASWFGVLRAGCVVVTTMALLRTNEIGVLCELTRPALAICDHRYVDDMEPLAGPAMPILTYGGTDGDDLTTRCAGKTGTFQPVATAADDVAMLAPTSGTTGQPKATMHFHRDVLAIADTFSARVLKPREDDVFAGSPPIGFTFGLGGAVVFPLRCGAATLLLETASPAELAGAIAAHRVSVLFTAPTAYRAMLTAGRTAELASLRRCVSAGEHLPGPVWEEFLRQTGLRIIDGIGSTEMLHIFVSAADADIRAGSTGRPIPGYQARIVDERGAVVPDGTPGRLAVKGPTGCRYLSDERQASYVQDGWNLTGDTYVRDSDGYFWYQARSDDMIVSSGYNIGAPEVEQALYGHPDVLDAAVVGVPDEARGALVKAFVVLRDGAIADSAKARELKGKELQDFVKQAIAPYKYPRAVEFIDALPRTETGKVQRYVLRERAAAAAAQETVEGRTVAPDITLQ